MIQGFLLCEKYTRKNFFNYGKTGFKRTRPSDLILDGVDFVAYQRIPFPSNPRPHVGIDTVVVDNCL